MALVVVSFWFVYHVPCEQGLSMLDIALRHSQQAISLS